MNYKYVHIKFHFDNVFIYYNISITVIVFFISFEVPPILI